VPINAHGTMSPPVLLAYMESRWESLGNVVSAPLRSSWHQTFSVFNDKLRAANDPHEQETWKVLCPPTGSGKTQALIVYAAVLNKKASLLHPGMIIVTRLISDADGIAKQINELSREYAGNTDLPDMAVSYHSGKRGVVGMSDLAGYPVLVICHKAYTSALDTLNRNAGIEGNWDYFCSFTGGTRKLVVIDEAIDLVDYSEITLRELRNILHFSEPIKNAYPLQWDTLNCFKRIFEIADTNKDSTSKEKIVTNRPVWEWPKIIANGLEKEAMAVDFTGYKKALRSVRMDCIIGKNDPVEGSRLRRECLETVSAVDSLLKTYIYYSRNQSAPTFNTARLLVPPAVRGGVVLDATATSNPVYDIFDSAQVIRPAAGTRKYNNVNLHASYGHAVGKYDMAKRGLELSQSLVTDLDARFESKGMRKVLVVTHKAVEPYLMQCIPRNFTMAVAHWGAVDGSNEWKDYDTVIIFGLPYMPQRWSAAIFMAYQGVQENAWLHDSKQRKFKQHEDIRKALDTGQMVASIVQAVNRVHCRKVVDDEGNCPKTDIFIMLPLPAEAETLLKGITDAMPGIQVAEWSYSHQKQEKRGRKVNRGNFDESLISFLSSFNVGDRLAASQVRKSLGIPSTTWERLASRLKRNTPDDALTLGMKVTGVDYLVETGKAFFIKSVGVVLPGGMTPVFSQ